MDKLFFGLLVFVWMITIASVGLMALLYAPHSPNPNYTTDVSALLVVNVLCVLVFVYTVMQLYFKNR